MGPTAQTTPNPLDPSRYTELAQSLRHILQCDTTELLRQATTMAIGRVPDVAVVEILNAVEDARRVGPHCSGSKLAG